MKVIGYTTGVFDLFHIGHLNLLKRAKAECDYLVVGVTTDELSYSRKAKYPVVPFAERMAIVEHIKCVDKVVPQAHMDKLAAWKELQFNRSEEHTSELQSRGHLVCRLLLEKKKRQYIICKTCRLNV